VVGTLVIQGLTLRPLVRLLDLARRRPVEREVRQAWVTALGAALAAIDGDQSRQQQALRGEYVACLAIGRGTGRGPVFSLPGDPVRRRALAAARQAVLDLRASGEIGTTLSTGWKSSSTGPSSASRHDTPRSEPGDTPDGRIPRDWSLDPCRRVRGRDIGHRTIRRSNAYPPPAGAPRTISCWSITAIIPV